MLLPYIEYPSSVHGSNATVMPIATAANSFRAVDAMVWVSAGWIGAGWPRWPGRRPGQKGRGARRCGRSVMEVTNENRFYRFLC